MRWCRSAACMLLTAVAGGCGGSEARSGWIGTVDTLPSGAVHVRNPADGVWDSASAWRIEEELRIGSADGEGPRGFNQIAALEVDAIGRVYVLEGHAQDIRVFDSLGFHVRTIGRKGHGPGEFEQANGLAWDTQGRLWVQDQQSARYTLIDTSGHVAETRRRPITGFFTAGWQGGIGRDGRVYEQYLSGRPFGEPVLLRYHDDMSGADTFPLVRFEGQYFEFVGPNTRSRSNVPYTPSLYWLFDPRGFVWFGITAPYRIYQRRLEGDTVRIIERAYTPLPVTSEDKDSAIARLEWFTKQGVEIDRSQIPDVRPAFDGFFLDDAGYLWVDPVTPRGEQGYVFDVFDPEGRYLGMARSRVKVSMWPPPVVRSDRLYAVTLDEDGIPFVARARIARK